MQQPRPDMDPSWTGQEYATGASYRESLLSHPHCLLAIGQEVMKASRSTAGVFSRGSTLGVRKSHDATFVPRVHDQSW